MKTGVFQSALILMTGLVYYAVDFGLMRRYDQRRFAEGSGRSWGYTAFMLVGWAVLVIQPVVLPGLGLHLSARWGLAVQGIGLIMVTCALGLHWWARWHLQQFYVEDVQWQDGQQLVDTGPYHFVRHPVFTSFFIIVLGLLLIAPAATTLLMAIYVFADFPGAARKEEQLLAEKLPGYASYMQRTGRFLPKWR